MKSRLDYVTIKMEVIRVSFSFLIENELKQQKQQKQQLYQSKQFLNRAPDGFLKMRERKVDAVFYRKYRTENGYLEENISKNPQIVRCLLDKRIQQEVNRRAEKNIILLEDLQESYQSTEQKDILHGLSPAYQRAFCRFTAKKLQDWASADYPKCEYEPQHLVHETLSGIFVRSKSEVIIANTLFYYHIPFRYEERLSFTGQYFYPDFRIKLPLGGYKIWEHLGLLSKMTYCENTANKLYTYQMNGFVIGKDLILTQEDNKGSCNSAWIDEVVRTQLLPHFL